MRSRFSDAIAKAGGLSANAEPSAVASLLRDSLRKVEPTFPDGEHSEALHIAFNRAISGLSHAVTIVNCHKARAEPIRTISPGGRPREFWALCGVGSIGLLLLLLAITTGNEVVSNIALLMLVIGALGGAMWGLASSTKSSTIVPETRVEVDVAKALHVIEESLESLDDAAKVLSSRLAQQEQRLGDDLPDDVVDILHRVLGDALSGKQSDRSEDVTDLFLARSIEVVRAFDSRTDYRFNFRLAPLVTAPLVARPALVRPDGTILKSGAVLIPDNL